MLNRKYIFAAATALAAMAVFAASIQFPFMTDWDDGAFILFNPRMALNWENIRFYLVNPFQDLYTPLPFLSFAADVMLTGGTPSASWMHLHNILLHGLCAWLLFFIIRSFRTGNLPAAFLTLLWALNPQKAESVVWIAERKDLLCGVFSFGAFLCFLRAFNRKQISYASVLLTAGALLSKPSAMFLPGVMVLYSFCINVERKEPWSVVFRRITLPVITGILAVFWSMRVTMKTNPGVPEKDLLIPLNNFFRYLLTSLVPWEVNPIHPAGSSLFPAVPAGILLLAGMVLLAWKCGPGLRKCGIFLLAVFGVSFPVLGWMRYTYFDFCDRYNYQVSAAVCLFAAVLVRSLIRKYPDRKKIVYAGLTALCIVFLIRTVLYVPEWKTWQSMTKYCLVQTEKVNMKAIHLGISAFLMTGDSEAGKLTLLALERNMPYRFDRKYGRLTPDSQENTRLYLHARLCNGQQTELWLAELFRRTIFREKVRFLTPAAEALALRDLAAFSMRHGNRNAAVWYMDREIRSLEESHIRGGRLEEAKAIRATLSAGR